MWLTYKLWPIEFYFIFFPLLWISLSLIQLLSTALDKLKMLQMKPGTLRQKWIRVIMCMRKIFHMSGIAWWNHHIFLRASSPHRSSLVVDVVCFQLASLIFCIQSFIAFAASCFVLFQSAEDLRAKPQPPHTRSAPQCYVLVSCSERPSRCSTELPRGLAGRL